MRAAKMRYLLALAKAASSSTCWRSPPSASRRRAASAMEPSWPRSILIVMPVALLPIASRSTCHVHAGNYYVAHHNRFRAALRTVAASRARRMRNCSTLSAGALSGSRNDRDPRAGRNDSAVGHHRSLVRSVPGPSFRRSSRPSHPCAHARILARTSLLSPHHVPSTAHARQATLVAG